MENKSVTDQLRQQQVLYNLFTAKLEQAIYKDIQMYQTPAEKEAKEKEQDLENIRKYLEND